MPAHPGQLEPGQVTLTWGQLAAMGQFEDKVEKGRGTSPSLEEASAPANGTWGWGQLMGRGIASVRQFEDEVERERGT